MVRSFWTPAIGFLLALLTTHAAEADVRIEDRGYRIFISGKITEKDARDIENISPQLEKWAHFTVHLDSPGGELRPALKIGRIIRKYDGHTQIDFKARCYSSCALIYIAGVSRLCLGRLGLHRPYLSSEPLRRDVLEKEIPNMFSLVKNYVAEMNITDNFYQLLMNTEPSEMKIFSLADADPYEIVPSEDPVYSEIEISYNAREHGITTAEMRRREHDASQICTGREYPKYDDCYSAIEWGLSEQVYVTRSKVAERECKFSDDEKKIFRTLTGRERREHPNTLRREECVRKIMLAAQGWSPEEFFAPERPAPTAKSALERLLEETSEHETPKKEPK